MPYIGLEDVGSATGGLLIATIPEPIEAPSGLDFQPGDVLFGKLRPYLAKSFLAQFRGCCSSEFLVLRSKSQLEPRFLSYVVQSQPFVEWANTTSDGAKMPRSDWEAIGAFDTWLPSPDGQIAIADLLDVETVRIDQLMSMRARLLALIEERFQAEIDDSLSYAGVEEMPLGRLLAELIDYRGRTPGKLDGSFEDFGIPVVSARNIEAGAIKLGSDTRFVSQDLYTRWMKTPIRAGDLLITSEAPMGEVARVTTTDLPLCLGQRLFALRVNEHLADPDYVFFALQSGAVRTQLAHLSTGSTAIGIRQRYLVTLRLKVPTLELQRQAAAFLNSAQARLQSLRAQLEHQIELLRERRRALITAAVTGQIPITGAA